MPSLNIKSTSFSAPSTDAMATTKNSLYPQPLNTQQQQQLEKLVNKINMVSGTHTAKIWQKLCKILFITDKRALSEQHFLPAKNHLHVWYREAKRECEQQVAPQKILAIGSENWNEVKTRDVLSQKIYQKLFWGPSSDSTTTIDAKNLKSTLPSDRFLSSAEQKNIALFLAEISTATEEKKNKIWQGFYTMLNGAAISPYKPPSIMQFNHSWHLIFAELQTILTNAADQTEYKQLNHHFQQFLLTTSTTAAPLTPEGLEHALVLSLSTYYVANSRLEAQLAADELAATEKKLMLAEVSTACHPWMAILPINFRVVLPKLPIIAIGTALALLLSAGLFF